MWWIAALAALLAAGVCLHYAVRRWIRRRNRLREEQYWCALAEAMQELAGQDSPLEEVRAVQARQRDLEELRAASSGKMILMLLGEFSSGKSSFINALLGEDVLTTKIRPTTAAVTILSYTEEDEYAVIHDAEEGRTRTLKLDEDRRNIQYLTAMTKDKENAEALQKIAYVELFLHCGILRDLDIIDTPGFNSGYEWHSVATRKFLQKADVVLWMFHAAKAGTRTEYELLQETGTRHKIAIVNQVDRIPAKERADAYAHIRDEIPTELFDQIFFVSSKKPKDAAPSEEYRRIAEIRRYLMTDLAAQKERYIADRKGGFFRELLTAADRARERLLAGHQGLDAEMQTLLQQIDDAERHRVALVQAVEAFGEYRQDAVRAALNVQSYLLPAFCPHGVRATAEKLGAESCRIAQMRGECTRMAEEERALHTVYEESAAAYEPLRRAYDDSPISNIADRFWNAVANKNFTEAKDNLDRAQREMESAERSWEKANREYGDLSRLLRREKETFHAACQQFVRTSVSSQLARQETRAQELQVERAALQKAYQEKNSAYQQGMFFLHYTAALADALHHLLRIYPAR